MKSTALMIAGPILSVLGLYLRYRKRNVASWMDARRLDRQKKVDSCVCSDCGGMMRRKEYTTGHRKGSSALVCENYPGCSNRIWG